MRNVDCGFAVFEVDGGELFGFVVAFGAPCDIVSVAKGVNVENVDVGGCEEEVLEELGRSARELRRSCVGTYRGEQMPWVEKEERYHKPKHIGGEERDDKGEEELVFEEVGYLEAIVLGFDLDGADGDVNGGED